MDNPYSDPQPYSGFPYFNCRTCNYRTYKSFEFQAKVIGIDLPKKLRRLDNLMSCEQVMCLLELREERLLNAQELSKLTKEAIKV